MGTHAVLKVEKDRFMFTGRDIDMYEGEIRVTLNDYVKSMERITEIRK